MPGTLAAAIPAPFLKVRVAAFMPLITREIRWFFDGALATTGAATASWFQNTASGGGEGESRSGARTEDWREDRYLILPDVEDIGVKLRQDRWEIKGRHALVGIQRFGDGIEGEVTCWTKWKVAAPEQSESAGTWSSIAAKAVLDIAKQRMLRTVRFTQGGVVEVPAGQGDAAGEVERGMHMELTRIRAAGSSTDTHWSLGFEAFPDEPSCCEPFGKAVTILLEGCPAKPLGLEHSMSYPRWLQRLGAATGSASE